MQGNSRDRKADLRSKTFLGDNLSQLHWREGFSSQYCHNCSFRTNLPLHLIPSTNLNFSAGEEGKRIQFLFYEALPLNP